MLPTQERRSWSNLQPELLELILQKLVLKDYLRCRRVCRWWRSAVNDALATKKRCPPAPQFPYLLVFNPCFPCKNDPATLLDITQNTIHSIPTHAWPAWEGIFNFVRSEEGWLMFQKSLSYIESENETTGSLLWIFNPVSGEKYQLPLLSRPACSCISNAVFSPAPDPQNFMVVICLWVTQLNSPLISQLYFCRVTDKSWTQLEHTLSKSFPNMVLLGRKLYVMKKYKPDSVKVFDLRDPNSLTVESLDMQFPSLGIRRDVTWEVKMAKDSNCGEVLLVIILIMSGEVKDIQVFKLDMSSPRWITVDSFDDRALLMDSEGVRVISTANLSGPPEFTRGNCVFFSIINSWLQELVSNFGVFFLKDKTIRRFDPLRVSNRSLWFTPNL